ncbi:hypothetical protein ABZZ04_10205 [Streptomyces sp. NPDC006435]|uniref:hypothetical protein n=1 Tax=Streptomyces sp. NPDC006435 TaxID=3154300 RepID=UPI0033B6853C
MDQEGAELCWSGINLNNPAVCAGRAAELTTGRRAEGAARAEAHMRFVVLSAFLAWSGSARLRPASINSCRPGVKPWTARHLARTRHAIPATIQATKKPPAAGLGLFMERVTRIELAL